MKTMLLITSLVLTANHALASAGFQNALENPDSGESSFYIVPLLVTVAVFVYYGRK